MEGPSAFEHQGVFQFMSLPLKVRCEIYRFAVIEPHPLELTVRHSDLNWFVRLYGVGKNLRMLGTCKEFCTMMKDVLYSENSFSLSITSDEPDEGSKFCQIDIRRIKKCRLFIDDLETDWSKEDGHDPEFIQECSDLNYFVETLVFKGGQMEYLLVECKSQQVYGLAENLRSLAALRGVRLAHLRSCQADIHHYFRFLEDLMMSDRPVPFKTSAEIGDTMNFVEDDLLEHPEWTALGCPGMTGNILVKSEEQMEATAKELYSILGMKGDFIPQGKLG